MLSFGLSNFRRLRNLPPVEIKPITILVGRNSSGKSSFLRALPLLRQSTQTRTSSPILWYGDFVDFGSYHGTITDNDVTKKMSFRFVVDNLPVEIRRFYGSGGYTVINSEGAYSSAECEIVIKSHKETAQIHAVNIKTSDGTKYDIAVSEAGMVSLLSVNDKDCLKYFKGVNFIVLPGSIFPVLYTSFEKPDPSARISANGEIRAAAIYLAKLCKPHLDKRLKEEAVIELCAELLLQKHISKEFLIDYSDKSNVRSWSKLLREISTKDSRNLYEAIFEIHKACLATPIFRGLADRLKEMISSVLYIGPARARSERYYRYQDLAVSEIDSDGKNFPMFLNSLRDSQFKNLSSWVESLFGYELKLTRSAGHISIELVEGNSVTNIVDTGYGVSQILPVLGQIWWAANKPRNVRRPSQSPPINLLAIEQPELHLHPAHQAYLADAIVGGIDRSRSGSVKTQTRTHFIIETHSETLVNRLGQLIAENKLPEDDVQILIFDSEQSIERETTVRVAKFGDEGQLLDWPYGFFQPDV